MHQFGTCHVLTIYVYGTAVSDERCLYSSCARSWFPIPLNTCALSCVLYVYCLCTSQDHKYVDGYRVQIIYAPSSTSMTCKARLGDIHIILHDVVFDNKGKLVVCFVEESSCCRHSLHCACTVLLSFISVGQPYIGGSWNTSSCEVLSSC